MSISEPFIRRPIATSLLMLGDPGVRHRRLRPAAGGGVAECRFSDHRRIGQLSGRQPRYDGLGGRHAARAAIRRDPRARPDDLDERHRLAVDHLAIRSVAQHRRARQQDVQQAINAASGLLPTDLPTPPTYRKTNPADRPVLIYAVHSDALPIYRVDDFAYTILAQKLSTVPGVSEVAHLRPAALRRACADQSRGVGVTRPRL